MDIKSGILIFTLLIGGLAFPMPEDDMSIYFEHVNPEARIVGGTQAAIGSHPHMVALSTGLILNYFVCGGSLITTRTILTAAHCIQHVFSYGSLSSTLRATVGSNRWNYGGRSYRLSRNVTHPNYVHNDIKNDLGILITSSQVSLTAVVNVISLSFDFVPGGVDTRVAGWGHTRVNGAFSSSLLELDVTTVDGAECAGLVSQAAVDFNMLAPSVEPHLEICTYHAPNFGTCNGDSGSALVRKDLNQQVGIVSWGFPCARGVPDMFVRISAYQDWLQQNVV